MHTVHGSGGSGDVRLWSSLPSRLPLLKSHTRGDTEDNHKAAPDGDMLSSAWCVLLSACALLLWLFRAARSTFCQRGNSNSSVLHVCRQRQSSCRPLRRCALLLLCAVLSVLPRAHATLIASSRISYCTNSGTDPIKCTRKMVVTLTVEAGQQAGEESLVFVNSAVDDTVSAGDAADAATVHFAPISITTSRSAVRYRYPIFYVQNYNAEPYEATVKGRLLNQCNADFNPDTATCGLAYDATGKAIPFSQGFCCDCSMCQTLGFCRPGARANKACNVFDEYTTASCLRFGQRWYSGYSIGTYLTWFTLNITVARNVSASGDAGTGVASAVQQQSVVLQLSPTVLGDTAGEGWGASARLVGSFAPADQPLDLTSRLLFAPALPATDERVGAGAAEWMLLSNTLVTLDGRECNKVGVSYEAFASQGNRCNLNPGSCLGSQLEDYRTADLARVAAGKKAQYMATGYGNFDLERVVNEADGGKTSPYISYVAASPAATMVVLTVDADDLEYIVGVATGKIVSAVLNKATLETSAKDGLMTVVVKNLAAATGRLVVSVQNCTEGVFPIAAQTLSLTPQQQSSLQFNVYMQSNPASGHASCTVVVRNAEEVVTDSRVVSWAVTETGFNNGTQGGTAGGGGGGSTTEESSAATCGSCATLNIVCAVQRTCWSLILLDLAVYLVIAAVVFCIIWFRRVVCCCFFRKRHRHRRRSGSRSSSSSRQRHRRHHRRRGSSGGSSHSPTRGEEGGRGSSSGHHHTSHRRSRSRASNTKSRRRSTSPRRRHTSRESSCGGEARYDTAVLPYPPPMTYAAAPPYLPPATYLSGGAYGAATPFSSSPFASPLRVQPPPPQLLPQAMPPAGYVPSLHSSCGYDTPSGYLSPRAFCPASSGSFAMYSPSPSPPPPPSTPPASGMAYGIGNRSTASQSPYTPALSACAADYVTGEDNVHSHARASARPRQHRRQRRRRSGSFHGHASHSRSPSPSQFSGRRERDPYA